MTAADRPSATDNTRAETATTTVEDAQVLAALNAMHPRAAAPSLDYWGTKADEMRTALRAAASVATGARRAFPGLEWEQEQEQARQEGRAAARAEMTAATTEDVRAEVERLLLRHGHAEWTEHDARTVAEVLDSAGLLATARTVNVHPTYTVEYQQKIADELGVEREAVLRALGLAAPLLATAHTRPSREQIITALDHEGAFCGVCGREPGDPLDDCDDCRSCLHRYADAVLALFRGGVE